jgi:catechol 2,3-dioxygenase-like lactoylglutathione lyase family enzyme
MADGDPVRTYGLTHVAIAVADPQRSFRFYEQLLGARLLGKLEGREDADLGGEDRIEFGTPGAEDVIVLMRATDAVTGDTGQLAHFGFRLITNDDPDDVAAVVERAGGTVKSSGHFPGGGAVVFASDLDGYEIELWFESDAAWRKQGGA